MDASAIPRLETSRLVLRAHRADDLDACAAMWADPGVVRHTIGTASTRAGTWSRMRGYIGLWALCGFGYWALEERESGRYVGEVGFADFMREMEPSLAGVPEAGWAMLPEVHGRGFATEALGAALAWADRTLAAPQTVALIATDNVPSMRLGHKFDYRIARAIDFSGTPTAVLYRERDDSRGLAKLF